MITAETEQKLIGKNINPTSMRLLVLDLLLKQNSAISLSDIEKGLETADRITIYRTLKTFEENGLAHAIDDGTGSPKYALCLEECDANKHHDLHVHFYCTVCKETFCLPNSKIPAISLPAGFSSAELNLVVKGVCNKCPH
ncbi:Fur family transcriptional regulator [Mucilaginibacter arboris]|uniref:Transcriptional repressor n=1 Tax=Mucilaginibacter arboris TaxID=2682090 RepID=A0A7K1SYQ7_9SPHI|nr:transcriptional repressor [Mucilaginibacter arboris]MVN22441.1 transcriptional repressor [Mucilaginibacter arboris]